MHFRAALPRFVSLAATVLMTAAPGVFGEEAGAPPPKVDFSYAFATPHRMTLGRPEASDRTLLDLQPGSLRMAWTYDNLAMPHFPPLSFRTPPTLWNIQITPQIDGKPLAKSRWTRLDGVLPGLENVYEDPACTVRLEAIGGETAALVRIEIANTDATAHQVVLRCDSGTWGENPAWLDPAQNVGDHLLAGWNDRADRVLDARHRRRRLFAPARRPARPAPRSMVLVWNLKPGEKRTGWLVRPYHGYAADLPELRKRDWAAEMEQGKKEWHDLFARAAKVTVPDADVTNAYLACLGDLFIMREPLSNGQIAQRARHRGLSRGQLGRGGHRRRGARPERLSQGSGRRLPRFARNAGRRRQLGRSARLDAPDVVRLGLQVLDDHGTLSPDRATRSSWPKSIRGCAPARGGRRPSEPRCGPPAPSGR